MSRRSSNPSSSENSNLPRRLFLKALSAAPLAAVAAPTLGQPFLSDSSHNLFASIEDERFGIFRHLVADELRYMDIANRAEPHDPDAEAKDDAAKGAADALHAFMLAQWQAPVTAPVDLLLRCRFMEFAELRYNADGDVWSRYSDPAKYLASGHLEFLAANPSFGALAGRLDAARFLGVTPEDMKAAIACDGRFAELDKLIEQSVALEVREDEAFREHNAETIASCEAEHAQDTGGPSAWVILHHRLRTQIEDVARAELNPPRDWLDLALQNKLADYFVTVGDADGAEFNDIVGAFIRHSVGFWGFDAQKPIDDLKPRKQPEPTEPDGPSPLQRLRSMVSDARAKIRKADARLRQALKREAGVEDGTAAHALASITTDRRQSDLDKLTDKLLPQIGGFPMMDGYQLQCELLAAHRPDFIEAPSSDRPGKVLQNLLRMAREHGDWIADDASAIRRQSLV